MFPRRYPDREASGRHLLRMILPSKPLKRYGTECTCSGWQTAAGVTPRGGPSAYERATTVLEYESIAAKHGN